MSEIDLWAIRERAIAAGGREARWKVESGSIEDQKGGVLFYREGSTDEERDHIAGMDPATTLALLDLLPIKKFLAADTFEEAAGIPVVLVLKDYDTQTYCAPDGIAEIRVGGIPWDKSDNPDPKPGEWSIVGGYLILGGDPLGGEVVAYLR